MAAIQDESGSAVLLKRPPRAERAALPFDMKDTSLSHLAMGLGHQMLATERDDLRASDEKGGVVRHRMAVVHKYRFSPPAIRLSNLSGKIMSRGPVSARKPACCTTCITPGGVGCTSRPELETRQAESMIARKGVLQIYGSGEVGCRLRRDVSRLETRSTSDILPRVKRPQISSQRRLSETQP